MSQTYRPTGQTMLSSTRLNQGDFTGIDQLVNLVTPDAFGETFTNVALLQPTAPGVAYLVTPRYLSSVAGARFDLLAYDGKWLAADSVLDCRNDGADTVFDCRYQPQALRFTLFGLNSRLIHRSRRAPDGVVVHVTATDTLVYSRRSLVLTVPRLRGPDSWTSDLAELTRQAWERRWPIKAVFLVDGSWVKQIF